MKLNGFTIEVDEEHEIDIHKMHDDDGLLISIPTGLDITIEVRNLNEPDLFPNNVLSFNLGDVIQKLCLHKLK